MRDTFEIATRPCDICRVKESSRKLLQRCFEGLLCLVESSNVVLVGDIHFFPASAAGPMG